MSRRAALRSLLLIVGFGAFGVLDAIVKGHHGGVRNAIGNVSAPWAIVPLVAGAVVVPQRLFVGAVAGAAASVATLVPYSLARAKGLGFGGNGGLDVALGNRWFVAGVLGGAALGAVGSFLAARQRWSLVFAILACLLALEPAARVLFALAKGERAGTLVPNPLIWGVEIFCGCAIAASGIRWQRASRS